MQFSVISRRRFFEFPTFCTSCNVSFISRDRYCVFFMLKLHLCFRKHKINKNKFKVQVEQVYIQQEFYDEKGAKFIKNLTFLV